MSTDTTEILKLKGSGYSLAVSADTEKEKAALITSAGGITVVASAEESSLAQMYVRSLAAFRLQVEKARVEVKKPVLELGRKIDEAAAEFVSAITSEEGRLKKLVGDHAETVAKAKREAEAEERRKLDEAKRAREEAERAEREATEARRKASETTAKSIADVIADKQAAREAEQAAVKAAEERAAAAAEQRGASAVVAATAVSSGVRFEVDFEVTDAEAFYKEQPSLCEITVPRREALAWLKGLKADGIDIEEFGPRIGLKVTMKPVVSTR
jgi:hypothetical protein